MRTARFILLAIILLQFNSIVANDTITLNLSLPTNPSNIEINEQGYWVETYNNDEIFRHLEFNLFSFNHIPTGFGGSDVGGDMSYWDGFTYCTSGDSTDYGAEGSSEGWISNQWGCMAGGGIKTDSQGHVLFDENGNVRVQQGNPYLVAYWGYWVETQENGDPCLQINFTDNLPHKAIGVYICNHPWPYYGNIHGDGFASPFTQEGDHFKLIAHGLNAQGEDIGTTASIMLAEFTNGQLIQSPYWQWMDLSALGTVNAIYFTMESTDMSSIVELGPNTAVYFCLDRLQVLEYAQVTAPPRPNGLSTTPTETSIELQWDSTATALSYNVFIDSTFVGYTTSCQYTFDQLQPLTSYSLQVQAVGVDSLVSELAAITASTIDQTPPTAPSNLTATPQIYSIELLWDSCNDNVGVDKYSIYIDGVLQTRTTQTSHTLTGLEPATMYLIEVDAFDASGNYSSKTSIEVTTLPLENSITNNQQAKLHLFPTCASNSITVVTSEPLLLEIFGINGQCCLAVQLFVGDNVIDICALHDGFYIARHRYGTAKFVKQSR